MAFDGHKKGGSDLPSFGAIWWQVKEERRRLRRVVLYLSVNGNTL